jgi:universal stress protein E
MDSHVLVIADQEIDSSVALRKASEFISSANTKVTVLAFIDTSGVSDEDVSHNERLSSLAEIVKQALGDRVDAITDIVSTPDIADYCARYCHGHGIDLVIKAGHRSESLVYTPLDWQLIRQLPCPIIIAVDHEITPERKLLVALDVHSNNPGQQELDRKVLAWAGRWANANNFTIYIASCIEAPEPLTSTDVEMLMDLETRMRPQVEPTIRFLLEELSLSCKGILVSAGSTDVVLQRLAEELNADLVVMGYTARHGLGSLLIGHTAEKVMHRLDRNLAVVQSHTED